jgi:hypothetical protein
LGDVAVRVHAFEEKLQSLKSHVAFSSRQFKELKENGNCFEASGSYAPRVVELKGKAGKCLEIASRNLQEHPDWSLWLGFALGLDEAWYPHAWNMVQPRGRKLCIIEPNFRAKLYYGIEVAAGSSELRRRGLSEAFIKRFDKYVKQFPHEHRKEERKRLIREKKYRKPGG